MKIYDVVSLFINLCVSPSIFYSVNVRFAENEQILYYSKFAKAIKNLVIIFQAIEINNISKRKFTKLWAAFLVK